MAERILNTMTELDPLLFQLKDSLQEFDYDRCLELARSLESKVDDMDGRLLIATAYIEVGLPADALKILTDLDSLGSSAPGSDEELIKMLQLRLSEARFLTGDPQGALILSLSHDPSDELESADREFFLGLCRDHMGDSETADEHFKRATELDPAGNPAIPVISADEAHELIAHVLEELPDPIRKQMEEVPVILENLPELILIQESRGQISPDTLGLYFGDGMPNRHLGGFSSSEGMPTASSIRIYRRNLERMSRDAKDLVEQVRTTLLDEINHHLGLDEDDVSKMGLA